MRTLSKKSGLNKIMPRLATILVVLVVLIAAATLGFMRVERLSFVDSLYFTVVTVATVGYGDIHPVTSAGKLFAVAVIFLGVGTFTSVVVSMTGMLVERGQEQIRRDRANTLVSLFFSEIGTELLRHLVSLDPDFKESAWPVINQDAIETGFQALGSRLQGHDHKIRGDSAHLASLKDLLIGKADVLFTLMENPNLLERESFAELLRSIAHLKEELAYRDDLSGLPASDIAHLNNDCIRVYGLLAHTWLDHVRYLEKNYKYLFSLAVRTNPFVQHRSVIIR